jgi:hypothetical protein
MSMHPWRKAAVLTVCALSAAASARSSLTAQPVGTVMAYAGDPRTLPREWLLCDGTALKASEYPDLFRTVGTTHGAGVDEKGAKLTAGEDVCVHPAAPDAARIDSVVSRPRAGGRGAREQEDSPHGPGNRLNPGLPLLVDPARMGPNQPAMARRTQVKKIKVHGDADRGPRHC